MISKMLTLAKNWRKRGGKTAAKIVFNFFRAELFDWAKKSKPVHFLSPTGGRRRRWHKKVPIFSTGGRGGESARYGSICLSGGGGEGRRCLPPPLRMTWGSNCPPPPTGPVMRCVRGGGGGFYDFETRRTKEKVSGYCVGAAYWRRVNAGLFLYLLS